MSGTYDHQSQEFARPPARLYRYLFTWQPSHDSWPRWAGVKQEDELQFLWGRPLDTPEDYLIGTYHYRIHFLRSNRHTTLTCVM